MELDETVVGESVFLGEEGCAESGLAVVVEFLIGEACEDGGLAHARVAHRDQLQLRDFALFLLYFRHDKVLVIISLSNDNA